MNQPYRSHLEAQSRANRATQRSLSVLEAFPFIHHTLIWAGPLGQMGPKSQKAYPLFLEAPGGVLGNRKGASRGAGVLLKSSSSNTTAAGPTTTGSAKPLF